MDRAYSLFGVLLLASASAHAQLAEGQRTLVHDAGDKLVDAVKSSQLGFDQLYAEFDLLCEGVPQYTGIQVAPVIEPVTGSIIWARSAGAERISVRYDLEPEQQKNPFIPRDIVVRGSRQLEIFVRTRQALVINETSPGITPSPGEIFLSGLGYDMATLEKRGGVVLPITPLGHSAPFELLLPGAGERRVSVTTDSNAEFHVTAWTRPDRGRSAQIEWGRDADGVLIPTRAVWKAGTVEGGEQRWTLITRSFSWGAPPPAEIDLSIPVGTVVTDYFESTDEGEAIHYQIGENGERRSVFVHNPHRRPTSTSTRAMVGGSVALVVLAVAFLRLRGRS